MTTKYISKITEKGNESVSYISQENAEENAKFLDDNNCINCTDCTYCINCTDCTYCINCTNCTDCVNCTDCTDCRDLTNKKNQ